MGLGAAGAPARGAGGGRWTTALGAHRLCVCALRTCAEAHGREDDAVVKGGERRRRGRGDEEAQLDAASHHDVVRRSV
jgi:hypothetical protein